MGEAFWLGRGRGTSGVVGGGGLLEVAAELGRETRGPGAALGMV